jgi:hypothetical protein
VGENACTRQLGSRSLLRATGKCKTCAMRVTILSALYRGYSAQLRHRDLSSLLTVIRRARAHSFEVRVTAPFQCHRCVLDSQAGAERVSHTGPIIHHQFRPVPPARKIEETLSLPKIDNLWSSRRNAIRLPSVLRQPP